VPIRAYSSVSTRSCHVLDITKVYFWSVDSTRKAQKIKKMEEDVNYWNQLFSKTNQVFFYLYVLLLAGVPAFANNHDLTGFIANQGQWPAEVLFVNKQPNMNVWITKTGVVFDQYGVNKTSSLVDGNVVRMTWEGASTNPVSEVNSAQHATVNFMKGNDPSAWKIGVPVYNRVRVAGIYPGVDAVYYMDNGAVRYDLDVKKGVALNTIELKFAGDDGIEVSGSEIKLRTPVGSIVMTDLFAYFFGQRSLQTAAHFSTTANGVKISVPEHNGSKPLTIDPLVYGTYFGGAASDDVCGVELTTAGVIIAGTTSGIDFPVGTGKYQSAVAGETDAFVAVMDKKLKQVVNYTYIGGGSPERARALTVDKDGNIYLTGETSSIDFPVTVGAAGQLYKLKIDVFVIKLNPGIDKLLVATYIGGNKDDIPRTIAVDVNSNIFVGGSTTSNANFPTTLAHQSVHGGTTDCFLAKLTPNGSSFLFCTYFGKAGNESIIGMTLDADGAPFVTGSTSSSDFETAPAPARWSSGRVPYDRTYNGGNTDGFLIKFFPDGTLSKRDDGTFSTYFGGKGEDEGRGVWVDALGRAVLVGNTTSTDLPTVGTIFPAKIGAQDIFMAVFTDDGRALTSCTYYGGLGTDDVRGVRKDPTGNIGIMFGSTSSTDFPTVGAGATIDRRGASDGFIAAINTSTNKFCTLVAGSDADTVTAIAVDAVGDVYLSLSSQSTDLYVGDTAWHNAPQGDNDGYVAKFAFGTIGIQSPFGGEQLCIGTNQSITWATTDMYETDRYTVELSTDGGLTWSELARDITVKAFQWKPAANLIEASKYRIRVSSPRGHVTSSQNFSLVKSPSISVQPKPVSACTGKPVTMSVVAEGVGLKYQWRKNGTLVAGATKAQYDIPAVDASSAGKYDVVVSGQCSPTVTSAQIDVLVAVQTKITTQPAANTTVVENKPLTLSVAAVGGTLTYQWQKNDADIPNAKAANFEIMSVSMADAGVYTCKISGGCGDVTSDPATVIVDKGSSVAEDVYNNVREVLVVGPIPATDALRVDATFSKTGTVTARFVNSHGAVTFEQNLGMIDAGRNQLSLSVATLSSGIYGLEIMMNGTLLRVMVAVSR